MLKNFICEWILMLLGAAASADTQALTLQFKVRAKPDDSTPRCEAIAVDHCRDDLDLPQVFEALRRMAAGTGASPFKAIPSGTSVPGVEVELGAGNFLLQRELLLSGWVDTGSYGALVIKGAGADKTVVSGMLVVPGSAWHAVADAEPRIAAVARSHIQVADLTALIPSALINTRRTTGFGEPIVPVPLEVFAGGNPMKLARWPNTGWAQVDTSGVAASAPDTPARTFGIRNANLTAWQTEPDLFTAGYFSHDWAFERIPVASVDVAAGTLLLQGAGAKFGFRQGQRVIVENALSELDSPGEWYFDKARRFLYFWPFNNSGSIEVDISVAPSLLNISHSSGVTVQQLSLQGSTGDAVLIGNSRNVSLTDAALRNMGNRGVVVEGGSAVSLRHLVMTDLGDGGVSLSGGDRRTLTPAAHIIEGCQIERFSRLSRSYRPAIAVAGVGIQVLRNHIADGPHSAIVFNGNDHRIEGNNISDVVNETNDAGAIYTGRDWSARGTVITNNLLQNIFPHVPGTNSVMGIYLDDQASGTTISGNVFANVSRAVFIGGGRDILVDHNIFVASSPAIFADNRGSTWQRDQSRDANGQWQRNLRNVPHTGELYRSRYAHLANLLDDEPGRSKYNRATGNLFVASNDYQFLEGAQSGMELTDNRTAPWSVFKTLRAPKAVYSPHDFDMTESALATQPAQAFPNRDGIAP